MDYVGLCFPSIFWYIGSYNNARKNAIVVSPQWWSKAQIYKSISWIVSYYVTLGVSVHKYTKSMNYLGYQ
jgi:hypothetical protein